MNKAVFPVLLSAALLAGCATPPAGLPPSASPAPLTVSEFRAAAEKTRISWRDPDFSAYEPGATWIRAKILGFNDFHGALGGQRLGGRPVGGAAVLAAYLRAEAAEVDGRAVIVHAGDHVGASPPVSALLQDEPAVAFLNLLTDKDCRPRNLMESDCNVIGTLGNHEFDEGKDEILRLVFGGHHGEATSLQEEWEGARFPYVAANVIDNDSGETLLPPYVITELAGVPVALIGAVLEDAARVVGAAGVAGLTFIDEAGAINRHIPELKAKGVRAIIVTIHQGLSQEMIGDAARPGEGALNGKIIDIVAALDDEVDIVVSGHAHGYTNLLVPNANGRQILLTQAFSSGTAYGDIDIALDPVSRDIVEKSAIIATTWGDDGPGLSPDAETAGLVARAAEMVRPAVSRVVGRAAADIVRERNPAGESPLGNLIADSMLAAMEADFAFVGPGGIRADIAAGEITWGDLFTVSPFGNDLVTMTLSGEQIIRLLNQQWAGRNNGLILQLSGLSYAWDAGRPEGEGVVEARDSAGVPLDPSAPYRVVVPSYLAGGGDGFGVFTEGTGHTIGPLDLDALIAHVGALPQPVEAHIEGRITRLN